MSSIESEGVIINKKDKLTVTNTQFNANSKNFQLCIPSRRGEEEEETAAGHDSQETDIDSEIDNILRSGQRLQSIEGQMKDSNSPDLVSNCNVNDNENLI